MKFLSDARVQEIAAKEGLTRSEFSLRCAAINAAMPEIARAVLEWAAKRFEGATEHDFVSRILRDMAREIEP